MKRTTFFMTALALSLCAQSQTIDRVLRSVEQNNKELRARSHDAAAEKMENRAANNLPDPSLSYSSFYGNASEGGHGTELVATQGFDFPTLYVARNRQATLQNEAVDWQQQAVRRDILLRAKLLCLDLVGLNQERALAGLRLRNADELQVLYERRLQTGDANALEVNRVRMERMNVQAESARLAAATRTALQDLLAMNGGLPLEFADTLYPPAREPMAYDPVRDASIAADPDLQAAAAATHAAGRQVAVDRQGWLPKLEVGFRRNTNSVESENGFVVGGSLPLFQNRRRVRIAKARSLSARLMQEDTRERAEATLMSLFNEMRQLREALQAYDVPLMRRSLALLRQALAEGEISLIEYFVEAESVYATLRERMQLENRYQKVMAELYKNEL